MRLIPKRWANRAVLAGWRWASGAGEIVPGTREAARFGSFGPGISLDTLTATGLTTAKVSALQEVKHSEIAKLHGERQATAYARASLAAVDAVERLVREEDIDCAWERLPAFTYAADSHTYSYAGWRPHHFFPRRVFWRGHYRAW